MNGGGYILGNYYIVYIMLQQLLGLLLFLSIGNEFVSSLEVNSLAKITTATAITSGFFPFQNNELASDSTSTIIMPPVDIESIHNYIELKEKAIGKFLVLKISSFLPNFDQIGHKILHANNEFVVKVLAMKDVPDEFKKDVILFSIKMAQHGDDFGSVLLQMYYDIVNNSL